jgi:hypothetical protein
VYHFFARRGEKMIHKGQEIGGLRKPSILLGYIWSYEMSIASERAPGIKNRVVMLQKTGLSHQPDQRGIAGQHEA